MADRKLTEREQEFLRKFKKNDSGKKPRQATRGREMWLRAMGKVHVVLFGLGAMIPVVTVVFAMIVASRFRSLLESDIIQALTEEENMEVLYGLTGSDAAGWLQGLMWWESNSWWVLLSSLGMFLLIALGVLILEHRRRAQLEKLHG